MVRRARDGGRRSTLVAAAATVALVLVGAVALVLGFRGNGGPPQPVAAQTVVSGSSEASPESPSASPRPGKAATARKAAAVRKQQDVRIGRFLAASPPVKLDIPSVGIHSSNFVALQVGKNGTLNVPGGADEVGAYADGPTPGQLGPAVLGAHVDSMKGPGIFYNLGAVEKGARIHVTRRDRSRVTFVVDKVEVYPKDRFPTDAVYYGNSTRSEIRLVTCGGPFDPVKHYLSNVVVFGHLLS